MITFIDDLKNQGLIEKEEIGFDQIISHTNRAFKDLKVAKANLDIERFVDIKRPRWTLDVHKPALFLHNAPLGLIYDL